MTSKNHKNNSGQKLKKNKESESITKGKSNYNSKEDIELEIPLVPEVPKKKDKITAVSPGLSIDLLKKIKELQSKKIKVVLVNCERCNRVIPVPIPKNFILKSDLPVVPVSYFHKNPLGKDQHCITLFLDHDFDIRRQRISEVVLS